MTVVRTSGMCLWFTGLSGAGKTTTARKVIELLIGRGCDAVLLDGDELRAAISSDLGFSKADRDTHVMRVAAFARDVADRDGIAVCALVSPYREARDRARRLIGAERFIEVFVDTPLNVCQARDPKGLYARARRGELTKLTGVDDPYEAPVSPDLIVGTVEHGVDHNAARIIAVLAERGCLTRC